MTSFTPSYRAIANLFETESIVKEFKSEFKKGDIYLNLDQSVITYPAIIDEIFQKNGAHSVFGQKLLKAFKKYNNKEIKASDLERKICSIAISATDEIRAVFQNNASGTL